MVLVNIGQVADFTSCILFNTVSEASQESQNITDNVTVSESDKI